MVFTRFCIIVACCFLMVACNAPKKTPMQHMEQSKVLQKEPLRLDTVDTAEKNISVYVAQHGTKDEAQTATLAAALQKAGYTITSSPSQANYVVLATLVYSGRMTAPQAQSASTQGYGQAYTIKPPVLVEDAEELELGQGLVVDVHIAARKKAVRVRNNTEVVGTASAQTVKDEATGRMVAFVPAEEQEQNMESLLMQRIAGALAEAL